MEPAAEPELFLRDAEAWMGIGLLVLFGVISRGFAIGGSLSGSLGRGLTSRGGRGSVYLDNKASS
jgi:hypothetical protein